MNHLSIDIETFSSEPIAKTGLYKYVQSPDFEILLFAYSLNNATVEIIDLASGELLPDWINRAIFDPTYIKHAYNAPFEICCLSKFYGQPLPIDQWRDTMLHGLYCGFTAGLDATGKALGLSADKQKLSTGKSLIRYFCTPCSPSKANGGRTRNLPKHDEDKWKLFKDYCRQDVVTEMEIEKKLSAFPVPDDIEKQWQTDFRINSRGVAVDMKMVQGALEIVEKTREKLLQEAVNITGLSNPNSVTQLSKWIEENTSETVSDLLVQVQNLARTYIDMKYLPFARTVIKNRDGNKISILFGSTMDTLSQLIRTSFIAGNGHKLVDADFSSIEARVIAWLSGEGWVLDVFKTHGKIYEATASQMFDVPIEKIKKGNPEYALRQRGKVATLALGYQGGVGALIAMGALNMGIPEEDLQDIVNRWRESNKRIVDFWYKLENAAIKTIQTGEQVGVNNLLFTREFDLASGLDFMTITLPSKRKLYYAKPKLTTNQWGKPSIAYYGVNQTSKQWTMLETYGGKLAENITQSVARDCLALAIENLEANGFPIVFHVHDEVVIDCPESSADLQKVVEIMTQPIPWAKDLPLNADGWIGDFFRKD